jgi:hypothetical protein
VRLNRSLLSDIEIAVVVHIKWDAVRYAQKLPKRPLTPGTKAASDAENRIRQCYSPLKNLAMAGIIKTEPCIVVDMDNVILTWYLPGILGSSRQANLFIYQILVPRLM